MNTLLMMEHKISLADIYEMIPWERTVYNKLIKEYVAKKNSLRQQGVNELNQ